MGKSQTITLDHPGPPRLGRRRIVMTIFLGLALAPLVYEASLLCAARWRTMLGEHVQVSTPILDGLANGIDEARTWTRRQADVWIRDPPWRPSVTIAVALGWAVGAAYLLRGVVRR
jgi:hypothetical protein